MFVLALSVAAAAAQPVDRYDGPQWPDISSDQPQADASGHART
jgi:hypothetical protein